MPWVSFLFTEYSHLVTDPHGVPSATSTRALQCCLCLRRLASALLTSGLLTLPRCRGDAVCWASV